jgi:argininosuccinate lyase
MTAYELSDQNPLGSAAGYGVPLPIDRDLVTRLLGFGKTVHNVLHASHTRGKQEAAVLQALAQVMVTLSRFSQDLILFSLPEFGYFSLPLEYTTGSSIMPQKANPDVLELVRARAAKVIADGATVLHILRGSPSGYNRDVQEIKEPYLRGLETTRQSVAILVPLVKGLTVHRTALCDAFTSEVFATDEALDRVVRGVPFRKAYCDVKADLAGLADLDPLMAVARKTHEGAPAGLDLAGLSERVKSAVAYARDERRAFYRALSKLLGIRYPDDLEPG